MLRSSVRKLCCFLFAILFLAGSVHALAVDDIYVIDDFSGLNVTVAAPEAVTVTAADSNLVIAVDCTEARPRIVRIPLGRDVNHRKMRLTFARVDRLPYMGKFETNEAGIPVRNSQEHNYLEYQKGQVYFSLDDKYYKELSFYFHCRVAEPGVTGVVHIDKIELVPLEYSDDRDFAYILAALLLLIVLLPGFLAYTVFFGGQDKIKLLALLAPLSLFSFVVLYVVLISLQALSFERISGLLLTTYVALNVACIAWLAAKKRLGVLLSNLRLVRLELLALFIVILCVAAIVTENLELPLHTFTYNHLKYLTYGAFYAHDPIFQYVNGIAILHDEPFSKYYENKKLIYSVQDRGIIVGIVYAVTRGMASVFNTDIAYSFGLYTLFGSVLNTLVLLPVFALHAYYFPGKSRPLLILFLMSANAFLITNYYITWYKLAGAGLVISGIVLLLSDKNSIRRWLMAGIVWGFAPLFHPGLVLTLPIVTVWLLYRYSQIQYKRVVSTVCAFFILIGSFAVMNLPWTIVKATHFEDTGKLFRQHYLAFQPYDAERGIIGSIEKFAGKYTFQEHVSGRFERLEDSLRIEEFQSLFESDATATWENALLAWNALETSYIMFVFAPLLVLLLLGSLVTRLLPATAWHRSLIEHHVDFRGLLITQVLTILLVIVGSFGPFSPDITWHIPMSASAIVIYMLVHANIATGKIGTAVIIVYSLFAYYRLFFQYF